MSRITAPEAKSETKATGSFTGRHFSRKPRRSVLWADGIARRLIAISGIGSIVAVSLVGLFLVWVVLPLLVPSRFEPLAADESAANAAPAGEVPVASATDTYGSLVWEMLPSGIIRVRSVSSGEILDIIGMAVDTGEAPSCWAAGIGTGPVVFGYADGTMQTGHLAWQTRFLAPEEVPPGLRDLAGGETRPWAKGLLARTPEGQLRHQLLTLELADRIALGPAALQLIDLTVTPAGMVVGALDTTGVFHHRKLTTKTNLLTGQTTVRARGSSLDLAAEAGISDSAIFTDLALNDTGDLALLIKPDGSTMRLDRDGREFAVSGFQDLVVEEAARITAATFLNGRISLIVGDSEGRTRIWFPVRTGEGNAAVLQPVHELKAGQAAVTALAVSERSRMLAVGYGDGALRVFNATNERVLGEGQSRLSAVTHLTLTPREDRLLVSGPEGVEMWQLAAEHGEFSVGALVRPIWYEGYPEPTYVWQSSAASDSFEPKLSLMPLIFGTLKATFYSLLFGLPLALLAAIFTSEFLSRNVRARVKPVIEIMASLPSVVLGFLAALVVAPWMEHVVVEVLAVLLLAPCGVVLGAHLWQMLPRDVATRLDNWRPVAVLLALVLGALGAWQAGPALERLAFAGDFKAWLDGRVGSGLSGWFVLLLVPTAAFVAWLNARHGEAVIRTRGRGWSPFALALLDLGRFAVASLVTVGVALFCGWLLTASGWDPRGSLLDTYVQRNALVVGIAMGFAVIPLIYTISEDALVSVPDHLRAASLGAGATPWQTAIRVVVPPAMSGLFSAAMIGLGRAVGETMIVLMAAGNTPIMEMNIFNGFRTLSANLAVELPEAVQNSTHYRTLFLAALTLFVLTFILNTVAEAVRLHFRGKTSRL